MNVQPPVASSVSQPVSAPAPQVSVPDPQLAAAAAANQQAEQLKAMLVQQQYMQQAAVLRWVNVGLTVVCVKQLL